MMLIKLLFTLMLFVGLFGCVNKKQSTAYPIKLDESKIDSLTMVYGNNLAILSCLRCGCFETAYNASKTLQKTAGYILLADTTCNRLNFPVKHLPSKQIESISEDIYNLTLVKKRKEGIKAKILDVNDSKNLQSIIDRYFAE